MTLKELGLRCRLHRIRLGVEQKEIARDTGYGRGSISAFECGRVNNALLLLWYVEHGLDLTGGDHEA